MLNITHYQRNANQNHNEVSSHTGPNGCYQSLQTINAGEGAEKREPSYTVGGNAKLVQPLWRTVWRFLKNLEIELPYDPATHCWAYTPRKPESKETHVLQCSLQYCL